MQKKDDKNIQQIKTNTNNNPNVFRSVLPNSNEASNNNEKKQNQQPEVNNTENNTSQQKNFFQTPVNYYNQQYSQPQLTPNMQQVPVNQVWQYPPNAYGWDMGQYKRENNFTDRYDSSSGLASFNRSLNDYLQQSGDIQIGLVEGQKDILMINIKEIWNKYTEQIDSDDKKNEDRCKENDKKHKEEMDKFDKNLDKEIKNIKTSFGGLIKNVFNNIDGSLNASKSGFITVHELMKQLSNDYLNKTKDLEDSKATYSELQQALTRMMDNHEFVSTTELEETILNYYNFLGEKYSLNIVSSFFYSLIDLLFGTNYHKDYILLSKNTKEILTELGNLNKMSKDERNDSVVKITHLINKHKQILSAMPTGLFEPKKSSEVYFYENIEKIFKVKDFSQQDDILALFNLCGADIFSAAYMNSSDDKKKNILKLIAYKIDLSDPETKKTEEEVFGNGGEKDFWQRKMRIVKFMLETKEDDKKKINEVLKKINNISELTEPLSPELEAQKRVISKYCGGQVTELINKTIGKKFKEKTALQEQLYFVDIINAKNDKFDAQKKRVKKLVSDVINEVSRYYNEQINYMNKFYEYEGARNVDLSSDLYRKQCHILLTRTINNAIEGLKKAVNDELGDYERDKEDSMKKEKEIIEKGIKERQDDDGKPKDGKALDLKKLQDWEDRNLEEEGCKLKEWLLKEIDVFKENMEKSIQQSFADENIHLSRNKLDEKMMASLERLQDRYKDIEIKRADANKDTYDKMLQILANRGGGRREF